MADESKDGLPVELTTCTFVTLPFASKVKRKRPVPEIPGRDAPGGNAGEGAYTSRGFGVGRGEGVDVATACAVPGHPGFASDVIPFSNESTAFEGRTVAFSPPDITTPTTSPFSLTIGEPIEFDAIGPLISRRSDCCDEMATSRGAPSVPASPLPTTPSRLSISRFGFFFNVRNGAYFTSA